MFGMLLNLIFFIFLHLKKFFMWLKNYFLTGGVAAGTATALIGASEHTAKYLLTGALVWLYQKKMIVVFVVLGTIFDFWFLNYLLGSFHIEVLDNQSIYDFIANFPERHASLKILFLYLKKFGILTIFIILYYITLAIYIFEIWRKAVARMFDSVASVPLKG